ncbi:hypothetical protein KP509_11G054000 [Ceratopteris richardii]|nr:hypothetical protein KP509_11G054000 [Ceratopteris richardii]
MDASAAKQDQPNNSYGGAEVLSSVDKNNDAATQKPAERAESTQECAKENEEKIQSDSSAADISVERIPVESVFDGTEKANELAGEQDDKSPVNKMPQDHNKGRFSALEFARKGVDWPEKAAAIKSFVIDRGAVMTNAFRRLSLKVEDLVYLPDKDSENAAADHQQEALSGFQSEKFVDAARSLQNGFERPEIKGRIILFSKSGCEESRAIRSLFRRKGQHFYEVNVDIFPKKKMDLEERTGTSDVPKVFFNENLVGGIDELCALEARKELDEKIKDVLETECPPTAPQPVTFGEDEQDPVAIDEFSEVVCKLREKVQVKDRFYKMRLFSRCFPGSEALEVFAEVQHCEKEKAVEFGRQVAARHFFHHVLQENLFEDGNHVYRFLQHDPIISMKCFNVNGNINDAKPLLATEIEENLRKFTLAIIDSYVSDDGKSVDYRSISMSEEFRRYVKMTESLHRFDLSTFTREEKLAFFINLYNMMIIHGIIMFGHPNGPLDRRRLFRDFQYLVGGYAYSLSAIQNGVLRSNQRPPYQLIKPFGPKDKRLPV